MVYIVPLCYFLGMKITITERQAKRIISEYIDSEGNKPHIVETMFRTTKYIIKEGLITTYNVGKTIGILKRRFDFESMHASINPFDNNRGSKTPFIDVARSRNNPYNTTQDTDNWMRFEIYFRRGILDNQAAVEEIKHISNTCGWFFTHAVYYDKEGAKVVKEIDYNDEKLMLMPITLCFRAKFNKINEALPRYLYHIAPMSISTKIYLKQGIIPHGNNRTENHPDRVYLYTEKPRDFNEIVTSFRESGKNEPYVMFKIDTTMLRPDVIFYYDSNTHSHYPVAVYTYEPINRKAIVDFWFEETSLNEKPYEEF